MDNHTFVILLLSAGEPRGDDADEGDARPLRQGADDAARGPSLRRRLSLQDVRETQAHGTYAYGCRAITRVHIRSVVLLTRFVIQLQNDSKCAVRLKRTMIGLG